MRWLLPVVLEYVLRGKGDGGAPAAGGERGRGAGGGGASRVMCSRRVNREKKRATQLRRLMERAGPTVGR